jgi:tetratricopeptide (TPR) repeat protein
MSDAQRSKLLPVVIVVMVLLAGVGVVGVVQLLKKAPAPVKADAGKNAASLSDAAKAAGQADSLISNGEYTKAQAQLAKDIEKSPNDQTLRLLMAKALVAQQKYEPALAEYEKAIEIGPAEAALHAEVGHVAQVAKKLDDAERHFMLASKKNPQADEYAFRLAVIQDQQGQLLQAKGSLLRAVNLNPEHALAWGQLADIELRQNNPKLAIQHIEKARAIQPDQIAWKIIEARARKRANDPSTAAAILGALPWDQQKRPEVLSLIAECLGMLAKPAEAAEVYARAASEKSDDAALAYETALWYQRAKDDAKSKDWARKAKALGHAGADELLK